MDFKLILRLRVFPPLDTLLRDFFKVFFFSFILAKSPDEDLEDSLLGL